MGYVIHITTDKPVTDFEDIVESLPTWCKGYIASKQDWGYSYYSDISIKPDRKEIVISGSFGQSGYRAKELTILLNQLLLEKEYVTTIESSDFEFD